jgi:transcriptional/translational regulatory protein YebC/TACO1
MIIEAITNNRQRTVAEIKNILERSGGRLATAGAVSHLFQYTGVITVEKKDKSFDQLMETAINLGASDIKEVNGMVDIYTTPVDLHKVKEELVKNGIAISSWQLSYRPMATVPVEKAQTRDALGKLIANLEEIEDVHKVYVNL